MVSKTAADFALAAATAANATMMVKSQYEAVTNLPLVVAFVAFAVAQSLKVFTTWKGAEEEWGTKVDKYKEKRWDLKRLYGSGGMPSSHSATVMALASAIGLRQGPASPHFTIALVLAGIVMYDASGVRLQAGRQAEVLNQIVCELPPEHPLADTQPLREFLGHTPPQVAAGALLGCLIAYMLHAISVVVPPPL